MAKVRKFKSLRGKGKRLYCRGGDIMWKDSDVYETSDEREVNCLLRAAQVVEVTEDEGEASDDTNMNEPKNADAQEEEEQAQAATDDSETVHGGEEPIDPVDVEYLGREELEAVAVEEGVMNAAKAKDAQNKGVLRKAILAGRAKKAAVENFEANKALLVERGMEVAEDITPEEAAMVVAETEGADQ